METSLVVQRFSKLFAGRTDVYGGEEGVCVKQPLTLDVYQRHLTGEEPIGVYPVRHHPDWSGDEFRVKWGCSDIDVDDLQAARNLQAALRVMGITAWVEVSRSKGYHVWVFAEEWVPAKTMRRALLVAHKLADVPATEVNPKQEQLESGQVGNYVRLPYPGHGGPLPFKSAWPDERRVMLQLGADNPISLEVFVRGASSSVFENKTEKLRDAAALWVPPPKQETVVIAERPNVDQRLTTRLNPLAWTIYLDGPLEGMDRSTALVKLAHQSRESELTPSEAYAIVADADFRWGKFSARPDGEQRLRQIVESAYG